MPVIDSPEQLTALFAGPWESELLDAIHTADYYADNSNPYPSEDFSVRIAGRESLDREGANHMIHGYFWLGGIEFEFTLRSGNWNGDEWDTLSSL